MSLVVCSRCRSIATCAVAFLMADCGRDEFRADGDRGAGVGNELGQHKLSPEALGSSLCCVAREGSGGSADAGSAGEAPKNGGEGGSSGGEGGTDLGDDGRDAGAAGSAGGAEPEPHGCGTPLVITQTTVLEGVNFAADFANGNDFRGLGCARAGRASPDAVFSVHVPEGSTVILRETAREFSIDPVLGLARSCSNTVECLASSAAYDVNSWLGVNYTAEQDEIITAFVSCERTYAAPYRISLEYPESLGVVTAGASLPVKEGEALSKDEWRTFLLDATEPTFVYGELKSDGAGGDVDFRAFDGKAYLATSFEDGDESVAFAVPKGRHFVEVRAYEAVSGYTLSLFTDPFRVFSEPLDLTDNSENLYEESAPIPADRSLFYRITVLENAALRVHVQASGGDPALSLYEASSQHFQTWQDSQGAEEFLVTRVSAPPAAPAVVLLRVRAMPEGGDIASHRVRISVATE